MTWKEFIFRYIKNIFEGNKKLFKWLYIYNRWDFNIEYPVIKIDWAGDMQSTEALKDTAIGILEENQNRLGVDCKSINISSSCFSELIEKIYEKYNQNVVILIDEYDKPILDCLEIKSKQK